MGVILLQFASETTAPAQESVTATFGISWQALLFQAITFLLVVFVLKKYVVGRIYDVIDAREKKIQEGLDKAVMAQKELENAQDKIASILGDARAQAEVIVTSAKKESAGIVKTAEEKAAMRAEAIVADAQMKLAVDIDIARQSLRTEATRLISEVSGAIIKEKLTTKKDLELIQAELEARRVK